MKDQKEIIRETNELKIMEAAELVFAQYGFKGATTDKISKQASLPKANIHYYYKTKANLYQCVLERILSEWIDAAEAFDKYDEPRIALTKYVQSKMKYSRTRPYASKVWANEIIHGAPIVGTFLETTLKKWLEDRITIIEGWIELNKIKRIDPTAFIYMIWSVTQHYADFEKQIEILNRGHSFSDDEFNKKTEQVTQFVLAGVGL